jgi:hypothetical protein
MDEPQVTVRVAPYQARRGVAGLVAVDLDDLRGPDAGDVELPLHLHWSGPEGDRTFSLDAPGILLWVYETILGGARGPEDLAILDGFTLAVTWADLHVPRAVRAAWENAHPLLAGTLAACP